MRVQFFGVGAGRLAVALVAAVAGLKGATIVSVSPAELGVTQLLAGGSTVAVSWTSTTAYSNVSIAAGLAIFAFNGGFNGSVDAYLMTQIGPGTTIADQVASTSINIASAGGPLDLTSLSSFGLFSGLTLGPGTYYLVLGNPSGTGALWWGGNIPAKTTVNTAAGVSLNAGQFAGVADPYLPASGFVPDPTFNYAFSVTGDLDTGGTTGGGTTGGGGGGEVPEPSTLALAGLGLSALVCRVGRRAR